MQKNAENFRNFVCKKLKCLPEKHRKPEIEIFRIPHQNNTEILNICRMS